MRLIKANDIAARLGVHPTTIRTATRAGKLPVAVAAHGSKPLMISKADADAYCKEYIRTHTCIACGRIQVRCSASGQCDPCRSRQRATVAAERRREKRAAVRAARFPAAPQPARMTRDGSPFPGLRVGATVLRAEVLRTAVEAGIRGGSSFLLAVTEGAARPTDRLGPWEVAACEVRPLHGVLWLAHLPPMGPTWHPDAHAVAAWVASILPREGNP